jgi:hypothetical protein
MTFSKSRPFVKLVFTIILSFLGHALRNRVSTFVCYINMLEIVAFKVKPCNNINFITFNLPRASKLLSIISDKFDFNRMQ